MKQAAFEQANGEEWCALERTLEALERRGADVWFSTSAPIIH